MLPRSPLGRRSSVWRALRTRSETYNAENDADRGNCVRAAEAVMHVHIRSKHGEHMDGDTQRHRRRTDRQEAVTQTHWIKHLSWHVGQRWTQTQTEEFICFSASLLLPKHDQLKLYLTNIIEIENISSSSNKCVNLQKIELYIYIYLYLQTDMYI